MSLLKISQHSDLKVQTIYLYPEHARAPKYQPLLEIQDQLYQTADALVINLLTMVMPLFLKKISILGMKMCDQDDLIGGIHPFILGQHTSFQRKSA